MKNYRTLMVLEFVGAVGFLVASVLNYVNGDALMGTAMLGASVAGMGLGINYQLESKQAKSC